VLDYDGMRKPLLIAFELVHGVGHKLCYEAAGLKRRVEVVGWSYCDWDPISPQSMTADAPSSRGVGINHILFAPIHPWADGKSILPIHRALNEVAYRVFLDHPAPKKTVRMFGEDEPNGITESVEGIDYQQSDLTLGVDLIDSAAGLSRTARSPAPPWPEGSRWR
jgi:hypothetical protein